MPGFRHSPTEDIQRIRQDLRDRYQDGFPILKELLQNADDAGASEPDGAASQLVLVLARNGLPGAKHPLLQSAGLAVLNDGAFTARDAISITSLGMSNKAGQVGAAGKFGLGLKSIFHWVEAFFYFSPHPFPNAGPNQAAHFDLLNPWWSRERQEGRHGDWEKAWESHREDDFRCFQQLVGRVLHSQRWFGLWIPLRTPNQLREEGQEVKPIEQRFPQANLDELLGQDWSIRLAETIPLLRRLCCVRVGELEGEQLVEKLRLELGPDARRFRFCVDGDDDVPSPALLRGEVRTGNPPAPFCIFAGQERKHGDGLLLALKQQPSWPSQTAIEADGSDHQVPEKAEPHGAVVFTRQRVEGGGTLRVQHAVFLPLGEPEECNCPGNWRYNLYLHGFFFVDSGRRRIQPFDGLPDAITPNQADSELKVIQLWNRTLLREVVAPLVLPSLDAFMKQEPMAAEEIESLVGALRKSETLKSLLPWLCRGQRFVFRLQPGGGVWAHDTWDAENGQPRRWIKLPKPDFAEAELFDLLPKLDGLSQQVVVSVEPKPFLATDKPESPNDDELDQLLSGMPTSAFHNAALLGWLLKLIPDKADERKPDSLLVAALVRLANGLLESPLPADDNVRGLRKDFFKRLPNAAFIRLPVAFADADPAIMHAVAAQARQVALLWQDWCDANGSGTVSWSSLQPLLQALGGLDLNDENAIKQRSAIAVRLLDACQDQEPDWPPSLAGLPLFACRLADGPTRSANLRELQAAADRGQLFTSGQDWAADLAKAAPGLRPLVIGSDLAKVLHFQAAACDANACARLLKSASRLAPDFTSRKPLFERLLRGDSLAADHEHRSALRCLLHGQVGQWSNDADLLSETTQNGVFTKLARLALDATGQGWRLVPHETARQLALNEEQRQALRLREISADSIEELLREVGPGNVDCTSLATSECDTILLHFNDVNVLHGLNIHETTDGHRVRIRGHTYVDDGSFQDLPEASYALVTRIRERTGYGRFQTPDGSNRLVNKLSWEAVIEIALAQPQPNEWWNSILTAIGQLGNLRAGLRQQVQTIAWLPLALRGTAKPADLLHLPGADAELDRLPPEVLNGKIPILRLAEPVRKHERFGTFLNVVLPAPKDTLSTLAGLLHPHPNWSSGLSGDWTSEQVEHWVDALADAPNKALPVAGLVAALHEAEANRALLPEFLRDISGCLLENAYAKVLQHLSAKHEQAETGKRQALEAVFLRYLRAIDAVGTDFARRVLACPGVRVLNAAGQWKAVGELAWPTHGVQPSDQLNQAQADALSSLHQGEFAARETPQPVAQGEPFDEAWRQTPQRLRDYFGRWTEFVTRETIGAFLAILGDGEQGGLREAAQDFLGQNTVDGIRDAIASAATQPTKMPLQQALAYHRFACVLHDQPTVEVRSVLGERIVVRLGGERETIFLGSGVQAFPAAGDWTSRWLHLLCFDPAAAGGNAERLQGLLRASAEQLLAWVFNQNGINLQPLWDKLGQPGQLHIRIAQNRVVEAAQAFLRQVGAHHTPAIKAVFKHWDAADRRRAEAEENNRPVPAEVQQDLAQAKQRLRELLAQDEETQQTTLLAVRKKMEQYQYDSSSVPFELWQNADDALIELGELAYDASHSLALGCVVSVEERSFALLHWGRLINEFQGAEGHNFRDRGFDQDLEKMVVQSVSDKGEVGEAGVSVTGKFGLGFKSVFLVSDAPEVLSGSVDFVIRGGIYPVRLPEDRREALAQMLKQYAPEQWRRGTIIHLPLRADSQASSEQVLGLFRRLASVLVIFSRRLKRFRLHRNGAPEAEFQWRPIHVADGVECGNLDRLDERIPNALVLTGTIGNDRGQWLLGLGSYGFVPLPKDVPVFWVTAPTRATPGYGFAVNGPFEPDVGRVQLALNSKRNVELADELARVLADRLQTLWNMAQNDWEGLRDKLHLASAAVPQQLAESLWNVLARHFAENCSASDQSPVAALARRSLWASEAAGLRRFYADNAALPTGLWGDHHTLTRLPDIGFVAAGALDQEANFTRVSAWPVFRQKVRPGRMVSAQQVESVLRRLGVNLPTPETVHLATAVEWELKQGDEYRAGPEAAGRLGQLIKPDFLKALKEGKTGEREEQEHKALTEVLPKVLFQAADGSWHEPADLVVANGEGVDNDETMRAAFAPPERRLNRAYTGQALRFFLACRPELKAGTEIMAKWILGAQDDPTRIAAVRYLLAGKLKEAVAEELRSQKNDENWLWQLAARPTEFEWFGRAFSDDDLHQLRAYVLRTYDEDLRERSTPEPPLPPPAPPPPPIWPLRQLWLWWEHEGKPIADYVLEGEANWALFHGGPIWDEAARKAELKRLLLNPTSPEGKLLWYRLFGYACLVSAGRTVTELRRFWQERLDPQRFWEQTNDGDFSEKTRKIFEQAVTAEFNNLQAGGEQAYFWRRVFYDIRKVHRMVQNDFPAVLLDLVHQGRGGHLIQFLRTGHLPGPEQPRWIGTFGQSADTPLNFIIRELFRLEVITDEAVRPYAFYVCRPVLRALEKIRWISDGDGWFSGEDWLKKLVEDPVHGPLLEPYFDIPLLHLGITHRGSKMPIPPREP